MELISFGDLTYLCEFYKELYGEEIIDNKFMNLVRDLRNASAHSNCLINKLQKTIQGVPDKRILDFVKQLHCVGKDLLLIIYTKVLCITLWFCYTIMIK